MHPDQDKERLVTTQSIRRAGIPVTWSNNRGVSTLRIRLCWRHVLPLVTSNWTFLTSAASCMLAALLAHRKHLSGRFCRKTLEEHITRECNAAAGQKAAAKRRPKTILCTSATNASGVKRLGLLEPYRLNWLTLLIRRQILSISDVRYVTDRRLREL